MNEIKSVDEKVVIMNDRNYYFELSVVNSKKIIFECCLQIGHYFGLKTC